jgi:hypothetical protein
MPLPRQSPHKAQADLDGCWAIGQAGQLGGQGHRFCVAEALAIRFLEATALLCIHKNYFDCVGVVQF